MIWTVFRDGADTVRGHKTLWDVESTGTDFLIISGTDVVRVLVTFGKK